jgi:hypothetical protein
MSIVPTQICDVGSREVHMMGDHVAVCWNLRTETLTDETDTAGQHITVTRKVRQEPAYIDFVWLREDDGVWYEDEDNIGNGGMAPPIALIVAGELHQAVQYLADLQSAQQSAASRTPDDSLTAPTA